MKSLSVEKLFCGYGAKHIVNDASFSLEQGEFCALLGLNGCGKSTLIKTLCALIPSYSGNVKVLGNNLLDLNEKQRAGLVSYIPQRISTIYGKTALDVVLMGFNATLGLFDNYSSKQKETALWIMEKTDTLKFASLLFEQLSEGQKQLVIFARTLAQNTPVVFMDEPDSALDFTNKNRILEKIKQVMNSENKTALIVLQDPNAALCFCDRLLLMKEGKLKYNISRKEFNNYDLLYSSLSDIYGSIKILDNNGCPVMVRS